MNIAATYGNMRELRGALEAYGIDCPVTNAEKPGAIVRESRIYDRYNFSGILFHCYDRDRMDQLCKAEIRSFDDILASDMKIYVSNALGGLVPAFYGLSKVSGHLYVTIGSHVLADLGEYDEYVA